MNKLLKNTLILLTIILLGLVMITYTHEETHKTIAEYFGHKATIKWNIISSSYTEIEINKENTREHEQLQDITDIVGYQMTTFYIIFMFSITFFLIFKSD